MDRKTITGYIGGLGLIAFVSAVLYYVVNSDFNTIDRVLLGIGVIGIFVYVFANPREVSAKLTGSKARYGSNTLVAVLAFIAIIGLVNVVAAKSTQTWDMTASKNFTLSDQTIKVLDTIKDPITVTAFMQSSDPGRQQAEDLLKQFEAKSNNKVTYEFIDPDLNPTKTMQYQATYGSLVFQSGDKKQEVTGTDESSFTSAILRLTSSKQKNIGFLTGHGERDLGNSQSEDESPSASASGGSGFSQAKQILQSNNYNVSTINLTTQPTALQGLDALVVADPQTPLLADEKNLLNDYISKGGNVLFLTDALSKAPIDEYLAKSGVTVGQGVVVDPGSSSMNDVAMLIVQRFQYHAITKDTRAMIVLPYATSLTLPKDSNPGVTVSPLAQSTENSWLETDQKVVHYDDGKDTKGPLTLAVAVETTASSGTDNNQKGRMVVVGDADFASDRFIQNVGNADFFVNSVNWLSQSDDAVSITPKQPDDRSIYLTGSQKNGILLSTVVLLPLTVLASGAMVWWRRR